MGFALRFPDDGSDPVDVAAKNLTLYDSDGGIAGTTTTGETDHTPRTGGGCTLVTTYSVEAEEGRRQGRARAGPSLWRLLLPALVISVVGFSEAALYRTHLRDTREEAMGPR